MLNEFVSLYDSLSKLGCEFDSSHPNFRKCPKGKASFLISLDEYGKVNNIKHVTNADFDIKEVYRWQEDNHTPTFPAFNVRSLFEIPDPPPTFSLKNEKNIHSFIVDLKNPRKKEIKSISLQELEELEMNCVNLWDEKDINWINKCLKDTSKILKDMLGNIPKEHQVIEELIQRSIQSSSDELKDSVCLLLKQKLIDTNERIYAEAIFAVKQRGKKKRRGKEHGKDFLYLLTIDDWNRYPPDINLQKYPTYHRKIQGWIKKQLELYSHNQYLVTGKVDAYNKDLSGAEDIFAPVDISSLGPTVPFASNDQIPCLKRYGLKGTNLFPVGAEIRGLVYKTINYIFDRQKEGITWKNITKYEPKSNKRKTVVFAYCTELKNANTLQFFDREGDDPNKDIYQSEEATKLALEPFEGIIKQKPDAKITITVLSAVDPGNTKIVVSRKYLLSRLFNGALQWQEGNSNIPNINLPWITIKKNKDSNDKINTNNFSTIYPIEVTKLLNNNWHQNGEMITNSKIFTSDEALQLLFEKDMEISTLIESGFNILINKSSHAIITAALKARHDYNNTGKKIKFKDSRYMHMLPSLYGLLLYKKGIRKEDYMNEDMFNLGKYFAVVDDLYIQYHRDIRSDNIPMSLLGNDHLMLALQNPLEAFVTLSRRLTHPYISWAKRVKVDNKPGQIAKYCLKKIAELTEALSKAQLPTDIYDEDKAKLLLGYLSYGAKKDHTVNNN